jgi:hypothetical protein
MYGWGGEKDGGNGYSLHTRDPYAFTLNSFQNIVGKLIDFTSALYSGDPSASGTRCTHTFLTYFCFSSQTAIVYCSLSNFLGHSYRQFQNLYTSNSIL